MTRFPGRSLRCLWSTIVDRLVPERSWPAELMQLPPADVRADLLAGLNPGVRLVPSHVMALGLAQERGFTYMKP